MEDTFVLQQVTVSLPPKIAFIQKVLSCSLFDCGSHFNIYKVTAEDSSGSLVCLVVKLPHTDKQSRRQGMYKEHVVLRYLESVGYPYTPRSLLHDPTLDIFPIPYSVQSFIDATPCALTFEKMSKLADMIRALHSVDLTGLYEQGFSFYRTWQEGLRVETRHLKQWIHSSFSPSRQTNFRFPRLKPVLIEAWNIINEYINEYIESSQYIAHDQERARPSLLHGDLGTHNFAWIEDNPYMFDWEMTSIGDPASDIAKLFRSDLRDTMLKEHFLSIYETREPQIKKQNLIERLRLYEYIAALQTTMWATNILANDSDNQIYLTRDNFAEFNIYHNLAYIDSSLATKAQEALLAHI